ncbi:2',3'-cyclic-nucleotide 3'-phosphodiesterase [Podospora appendiculata]|uniref:2',3'-cyclic-nucleotide 3'-phosphodiesterase n=1 Tax=Podospora appendiculata TaxID=314037 RepID=A0AAE0X0S5_9PEZI|nr:2',3'-cyclic-nucleotide 3'-phosphodiesterase [Podospora appendiculata]
MPGSSLWLLPPPSHPLHATLSKLISSTLPSLEPSAASDRVSPHFFAPHMTLTSGISPSLYSEDPQGWLDSIPWPRAEQVRVRFEGPGVQSQDVFFRRCFIKVQLDDVREIAGLARAWGVNGREDVVPGSKTDEWLREWPREYVPHVSLMYGDMPLSHTKLKEVTELVEEAGILLSETNSNGGRGGEGVKGWDGGVVWLVETGSNDIQDWKPIASRELS